MVGQHSKLEIPKEKGASTRVCGPQRPGGEERMESGRWRKPLELRADPLSLKHSPRGEEGGEVKGRERAFAPNLGK